jgi:glycosyltransferase involved in cell wall biosynthesis
LLSGLEKLMPDDSLLIYCSKDQAARYTGRFRFRVKPTPLPSTDPFRRVVRETFYWGPELRGEGIRLFHAPISYLPFRMPVPAIVTLHDLRVFRFPRTYSRIRKLFLRRAIKYSVATAARIITVSAFTAGELRDRLGIPSERIRVIHEGIRLGEYRGAPRAADRGILRSHGIHAPYVLTVGHLEPRKNYARLLEAYERLDRSLKESLQLVIVGRELRDYEGLYRWTRSRGLSRRVVFPGFVSTDHLRVLYRNARAFVFPSIYEGFGFPPLESLASGVPVAASNASAMPEVLGGAAIFFDPFSVDGMADALRTIVEDSGVRQRIMESAGGVLRKYDWDRCAKDTLAVYQEVLGDSFPGIRIDPGS